MLRAHLITKSFEQMVIQCSGPNEVNSLNNFLQNNFQEEFLQLMHVCEENNVLLLHGVPFASQVQ